VAFLRAADGEPVSRRIDLGLLAGGTAVKAAGVVLAVALATFGGMSYAQNAYRIYVGPNVRVSLDSEKSHFEPMLASAPGGVLIASANLTGGDNAAWITKAYVSRDNGNTWFSVWFPRLIGSDSNDEFVSGDSAVATGAHGRLFYAALCRASPSQTHTIVTCLYHSDDRGASWSPLQKLNIEDHERFATDPSSGLVVMAGKWSGKENRLVLYVSRDNGGTFSGPLTYANALGIAFDPCLLPGGAIFLPFVHESKSSASLEGAIVTNVRHASKPFTLYPDFPTSYESAIAGSVRRLLAGDYATAAAPAFVSYGSRIYAVDSMFVHGAYEIVVRTSTDRGRLWSAPRDVSSGAGAGRDQFAPSVAVNDAGVLGVAWSEMDGGSRYEERFAASMDGGRTFLPARAIATRDSNPYNDENVAGETVDAGPGTFFQYSGFTTRSAGGDYFGMAADSTGVFHPLWIDSRDGVGAQVYTASVAVLDRHPACVPGAERDLTKTIHLVFDPPVMHVATRVLQIPIRLQNAGDAWLTGPLTFTVTHLQADEYIPVRSHVPAAAMPRVLGAANGATGVGATLDFSQSLGDFGTLAPHSVSNPVELRLRLSNPLLADPVIGGTVRGRACM
jgi:hypothetical protein